MEIDAITQSLNEYTNGEFDFALRSASLSGETCTLEITYKDGSILRKEKRQELTLFALKQLPAGFVYNIKFVKNFITSEVVEDAVKSIIAHEFPALVYSYGSFDEENGHLVVININSQLSEYAKNKNVESVIAEKLKERFLSDFVVKCDLSDEVGKIEETEEEFFVESTIVKHEIDVDEVNALCGEKIMQKPIYIRDALAKVGEDVVVCGKIKFLKSDKIKSKKDKKEDVIEQPEQADTSQDGEEAPVPYEKKYYKFSVEDFSGEIKCIYFSTKTTIAGAEKLADGSEVVLSGVVEEDKFAGGVCIKTKNISLCILPKNFKEPVVWKTEPEHYRCCFPEPYVDEKQVDLFSVLSGNLDDVAPYLKDHDVVVFDLETTGLSAIDCKIIEIGAVKIHNGKIIEKFETFVNPKEHIADDSTLIHGITDDDVKDAPVYEDALADFYKFTRNSTLVAYNIAFDYSFISTYGTKAGYNFDNPQIDALKLATKNVKGVKNYKLKTIADSLGVLLDNAHRAVYDAIATAEVFIKLDENGKV